MIIPKKIDLLLILCLIRQESCFDPTAQNSVSKATGLMQLMPRTFAEWTKGIKEADQTNPVHNMIAGLNELNRCINKFKDVRLALTAYNWGIGNLTNFIEQAKTHNWDNLVSFIGERFNREKQAVERWIMPKEAREYAERIFRHYNDPEVFELLEYWRGKE